MPINPEREDKTEPVFANTREAISPFIACRIFRIYSHAGMYFDNSIKERVASINPFLIACCVWFLKPLTIAPWSDRSLESNSYRNDVEWFEKTGRVKETVNACDELQQSWAKGLVNAILRRFLREKDTLLTELDRSYDSRFAYPEWLVNAIKSSWKGIERPVESILDAGNQRPPMTLRINQQFELEKYKQILQKNEISFSEPEASLYSYTIVLDKPVSVDKLPFFSEGALSVQDGAPQLAASLLSPQPGDLILDACAAPGGKTMHLFEQQASLKKVVALDVSSERLKRVQENSRRLKIPDEKLLLMTADASKQDWWDGEQFDRILLDAPCSATGVIRRHPDIKLLRREEDISALTQLQAQIMDNLWLMLKPGGLLLYATCSIIRDENDRQIEAFLNRQKNSNAIELLIDADWGIRMPFGRQILPGEHNMDGFYYALLRKSN